ncbi:uncharacterized protein LOC143291129 isoform X19 [Babylonia areolata]|uniref:uncharacterized protein LOC143291129 isoform X19 n=1 Tax=Babylonia areolata TaxID=304850 RepID=UPI003FCF6DAD
MDELLKNAKSLPNSRLYVQAEAVQTVDTGYGGPLPPALMDQLAAAAAAQYVVPPGPQPTSAPQPPPPPPSQVQMPRTSAAVDASVQTDVSTVIQSKQSVTSDQEMARAQIAAANRLLASTSSGSFNSCEYCGRVFSKKEYLRRHVRIHTGERPYRCVVCQLSFRRSHHLRRHELMHTDIRPFSCHACDKAFKQKQHLERHLASHTDLRAFACSLCDKAFKQKQHLDRHLHCHSDVRAFGCSLCHKAFKQKQHLDKHLQCHSDLRAYGCSLCHKAFKQKQHLDKHLLCHSDLRAYGCSLCHKAFKQKQHLDKHLHCHSDVRAYVCSLCHKAFKQKQHLDKHLQCHSDSLSADTDLKPFICSLCHKGFKQKQHLDRHYQCHSDVKPYSCTICDKAFKQKQHLDRHHLSHTGEKPYACHMCEKAFTRKQHLDRHIKMHTGELERTYKCHVCEKMFFRSHHRDKHLKSHGISALETKSRSLNFSMINIDLSKASNVDGLTNTSAHSASSDSGSDTDDDQKPPVSDKPNSQVSKMVEGCRKRKTHSPVRLTPGEKKRSSKTAGTSTGTSTTETSGQQTPNMGNQRNTFEYSTIRNDIVFPRNEAVNAMAMRDGAGGNGNQGGTLGQATATSTDGGMQTSHPLGSTSGQTLDALQQQQQQQQQQQFSMGGMNCLTTAQLQQLQQQMAGGKVDGATQHQEGSATPKTSQPLVVPSSHFTSASKLPELQGPKYTSAAAAIAGRQLQQAGVGVGVMEQPMHFKSVVGTQGAGAPHQTWPPTLNWPPRLSLMPDGSLQGMPTLTTYGTVNMADLNQVSGAAMYTAQKAMEMRMAAGLHRPPSIGGESWVPVSGADRDAQRGGPSTNDRRIYSPQPNT